MSDAPYLWLGRPGQEVLRRGVTRELAEQSADASYDQVIAPPCPACGRPVSDKEWERHKYEAHAINEMVQPWGEPDAREALFLGYNAASLEQKIAIWRSKHPGVRLELAADGTRGKLVFKRYRIMDAKGKPA